MAKPTARDDCELCEAARFTHWYYSDETCWVADCEACDTPMVVWNSHGNEPSETERAHMFERLMEAADLRFGSGVAKLDETMRQVPDHFHAHARDKGWATRRWSEPISRYTGVGAPRRTGPAAMFAALVVLLALVALVLSACGGGEASPPPTLPRPPYSEGLLDQGEEVYTSYCAICHGVNGEGRIGPALVGVSSRLTEPPHVDVILHGRGQMRAFRRLLEPAEITAVVAYQRQRFG